MNKLIAHRGDKTFAKENSLAAFFDALKGMWEGFECDLRQTKDGKFIIYHDAFYEGKLVRKMNYKEFDNIPCLEDVLKIKTEKMIIIDIKDPLIDISKLEKTLLSYENSKLYVMSFYEKVIRKLYENSERKYHLGVLNYVLNTNDFHFAYDFLAVPMIAFNQKLNQLFKDNKKVLMVYAVKKSQIKDEYPYYIVD